MRKLIAITDLHITQAGETIIGLDPADRLRRVLDAALRDHPDAQAIVAMGDLTHHGDPQEYARLAAIFAKLPVPVIPMLGNHDRRAAFYDAFPDAPRTSGGFVQGVTDIDGHRLITLDTLDGPPYPKGHHAGRLCAERMAWLHDALAGAQGRIPLVFAHHPPFLTGIAGMDKIPLAQGDAFLDSLAPYAGAHLFCGHVHRTISGSSKGVAWTMLKSTCHQGVLELQTEDSSLSVDEPASYGLILLMPDGVVCHSQDVGLPQNVQRDGHSS